MSKRKLVVVNDSGPLRELDGVCGPIVSPSNITITAIKKMISVGRTVLECDPRDPYNTRKRIQLNLENVTANNFGIPEVLTHAERVERELARLKPLADAEDAEVKQQQEAATTPEDQFRPDEGATSQEGDSTPAQGEEETADGQLPEEETAGEVPADQFLTETTEAAVENTAEAEVPEKTDADKSDAVPYQYNKSEKNGKNKHK